MKRQEFFKLIRARVFFKEYCPEVRNYAHKMRGTDGNRKPIDFTEADKQAVKAAAARLGIRISAMKF
jgi:hypothetical protein